MSYGVCYKLGFRLRCNTSKAHKDKASEKLLLAVNQFAVPVCTQSLDNRPIDVFVCYESHDRYAARGNMVSARSVSAA